MRVGITRHTMPKWWKALPQKSAKRDLVLGHRGRPKVQAVSRQPNPRSARWPPTALPAPDQCDLGQGLGQAQVHKDHSFPMIVIQEATLDLWRDRIDDRPSVLSRYRIASRTIASCGGRLLRAVSLTGRQSRFLDATGGQGDRQN